LVAEIFENKLQIKLLCFSAWQHWISFISTATLCYCGSAVDLLYLWHFFKYLSNQGNL